MKIQLIGLTLISLILASCATTQLTEGGVGVTVVVKEEPKGKCKQVSDVETGRGNGSSTMEILKIKFRNAAAEQGANVVTIDTLEKNGTRYYGSGRSFLCS